MLFSRDRFARNRNRNRSRLSLETLEGRQLLTLGPEFGVTVNVPSAIANFNSANASTPQGSYVVVWDQELTSTTNEIVARRFNSLGQKVGPQIQVSGSTSAFDAPSVAIDNNGDFVVAWTQSEPGGDTNVIAQKFNASGVAVGSVVPVGVGTFKESQPHVAMDAKGDFVVAYTRDTNNNNPDIFAKMYNVNEQLTNVVSVATTSQAETNSSVAMTPDGRFDVAWEDAVSATNHDVLMNQYSSSGSLIRSLTIANTAADETVPGVSMDNLGNAVVAWQSISPGNTSILARRVSASGVLGGPIVIDSETLKRGLTSADSLGNTITGGDLGGDGLNPSVALEPQGGAFVVAYDSPQFLVTQVNVAEVSATGTVVTANAGPRFDASVSMNQANQYVVTDTSDVQGEIDIRQRHGQL